MKRLLPLGVLLLAGTAQAALLPVKPRCPGMAELKKKLANASLVIPAAGVAGDFDGKQHCDQTVWNYLAFHAKERVGFNALDGKQQLDIIEKYTKQLEDVERRISPIKDRVAAYKADVAAFREAKTKAGKKLELLDRIIVREGEPDSLDPSKVSAATVIGGSGMLDIRKAFAHLAEAEMLKRHGAQAGANGGFGAAQLKILWDPAPNRQNQNAGTGAFNFVDWGLGQQAHALYKEAIDILNGVNAEVRGPDGRGRLAELKAALMHQDVKEMLAAKEKAAAKPKPQKPAAKGKGAEAEAPKEPPKDVQAAEQKVGDATEAFRKSFADKTSAMIFDGLDQRTKLDPSDPNHLTVDQARLIREEFKGDAEIEGKKVVYTVTDSKGKKMKIGSEVELPADLSAENAKAKAEDHAKGVADNILKAEHFKATVSAVIGAVVDTPHAAGHQAAHKPTVTVDPGAAGQKVEVPKDFAADVAAANCGSPLDLARTKEEIARRKKEAEIAKMSAERSQSREEITAAARKGEKDAEAAYKQRIAAIEAEAAKEKQNPFFTDYAGQAKRVAEAKAAAEDERVKAVGAVAAEREAALKKLGTDDEHNARVKAMQAEKEKRVRAYYEEKVAERVDTLWGQYKNRDAAKISRLASKLGTVDRPVDKQYISADLIDAYFKKKWADERQASMKQLRADIGVPDEGEIKGSLPSVDAVDKKIEDELVAHFKAIKAEAARRRAEFEKQQAAGAAGKK